MSSIGLTPPKTPGTLTIVPDTTESPQYPISGCPDLGIIWQSVELRVISFNYAVTIIIPTSTQMEVRQGLQPPSENRYLRALPDA